MEDTAAGTLARLLRQLRMRHGLTQEELAQRAELSTDAIRRYEQGSRRRPHLATIERLAGALDLTEDEKVRLRDAARARAAPPRAPPPPPDAIERPPADYRLVTPAPHPPRRPAVAPGWDRLEDLRRDCESSVRRTIGAIPKYAANRYVAREGIAAEFGLFLASEYPALLIQGEAGVGKTNLLCHLAEQRVRASPTLLFRGTMRVAGRLGFWEAVAAELSAERGSSLDPAAVVPLLDRLLEAQSGSLVIFVDAINENQDVPALRESLAHAVLDAAGTRIRICLSCRDVDWRLFEGEVALTRLLYEPQRASGRTSRALALEDYTDREWSAAWTNYSAFYGLTGGLTPRLESICRHPLMLQFLCEAYRGQSVPPGIHRKEIFDRYWKEKLGTRHGLATESAVYRLVGRFHQARLTSLSQREVVELIGEREYATLCSEQVIIYTYLDPVLDQHRVGFTYDAFLEYAMARHLRQAWDWPSRDDATILRDLASLRESSGTYRVAQGVIMYLLLFLGGSPAARDFLRELAALDTQWKVFFADFVTKVNDLDFAEGFLPLLARLVRDDDFTARWAAGNALGLLAQHSSGHAGHLLVALTASADWMEREAAALAASHLHRDFPQAVTMLERLADDINWRVRRAVGCAMENLCRTMRDPTFAVLRRWCDSDRWRLRRAVAQAKYGLLLDPVGAMRLLHLLAHDANEEVRWRAVSDLAAIAPHLPGSPEPLELIEALTRDDDVVVRRHAAFWLPDLFRGVGEASRDILRSLAADRDRWVRWETARALGSFPAGPPIRDELALLAGDDDPDVAFAALYSQAAHDLADRPLADLVGRADERLRLPALREELARTSRILKSTANDSDIYNTWKHDRYASIREVLSRGTAELDTPERVLAFFDLLRHDPDEGIRWALASLLPVARMLDPTGKHTIALALLVDPHYWVRRETLMSLQGLLSEGFTPSAVLIAGVLARAGDRNPEVRHATLGCLIRLRDLGQTEAGDATLEALRADEDRQVRELAETVLHGRT